MQRTFDFYCDPGHGWAKVPKKIISILGIEDKISHYSYIKGENVYLEEDSDFSLFYQTFKQQYGKLKLRHHHTNRSSRIRNYESFKYNQ